MATWSFDAGPLAAQYIMEEGVVEEACSSCGIQEAERKELGVLLRTCLQ